MCQRLRPLFGQLLFFAGHYNVSLRYTTLTNITISEWNDRLAHSLLLNIIMLVTFLILALIGNIFVMLVYIFRMKKNVEERYHIPILSFFDVIAATVCNSFMIYQCYNYVTFQNEPVCKALVFFVGLFTYIPILLLVVISTQRYLRLCLPTKPALTVTLKRT